MNTTLNTNKVNGYTAWQSQMVTMNTRSQAKFDDNVHFPYLTEGVWYKELPTFTDSKNLLTTMVDSLKSFSVKTVDINSADILVDWRLVFIGAAYYIYSDWPIPVDLSYSNADLLTGATGGFPVGDLNWFPAKKALWAAQRDAENTAITTALNAGTKTIATDVDKVEDLPIAFQLQQNYPNPFNPSTKITFSLAHSANTSLKVFDMLGREVATLVNGYTVSGTHDVQFNAMNLASGIYYYKLTSGNFTEVKKMVLLK
jgi:hypothetical protein